jgi:hypothetical protein
VINGPDIAPKIPKSLIESNPQLSAVTFYDVNSSFVPVRLDYAFMLTLNGQPDKDFVQTKLTAAWRVKYSM